ncbi:MAG: phosphopantothenoylcysteine decarboxylase [Verrucomicrobia bacterium]|nr:phosphopantothenoylcysteine decarboxylase [Verrucomicrobiota bacterium]
MKKVLILSGPTHEYFDPVRFIGNASSGKMGKALAEEAIRRGMDVEFISGPVPESNLPKHGHITRVTSAGEMLAAAKEKFAAADLIIFAAAVADFQPLEKSAEKFPKVGNHITIELKPTPDIAATLCANKRKDQIAIGFALQTHNGETRAREKLISKNLNGVILNTPATLGADSGLFTWIDSQGLESWGSLDKAKCAERVFSKIESRP